MPNFENTSAIVTPQQFEILVDLISEPYATMVYTAIYTGLRVSWRSTHIVPQPDLSQTGRRVAIRVNIGIARSKPANRLERASLRIGDWPP